MARMYAVDRRVYIGDEARPMYNASVFGMALYYVSADDLTRLGRRRFLSQGAVVALFVAVAIGVARHTWSAWWIAGALLASPLASAFVGEWVRERYEAVTNPAVVSAVHQRMFQDNDPIVGVLLYFALTLPDTARWIQQSSGWSALGITTLAIVLQAIPRMVRAYERKRLQLDGHTP